MSPPRWWKPPSPLLQAPVIVACSGGADSTALALLLHEQGAPLQLAHVNYGLRGADSDADQAFVEALAQQLNVPCHVIRMTVPAKPARGLQAEARRLRYRWLRDLAKSLNIELILTAHHQDDVAETALLHLVRGHGPLLKGIRDEWSLPGSNGIRVWRPLLQASKAELIAYLQARNQPWREDASNATDKYARNIIRNRVMPALRELHPNVTRRLAERVAEAEQLWEGAFGNMPDPRQLWKPHQEWLVFDLADEPRAMDLDLFLAHSARHLFLLDEKHAAAFGKLNTNPPPKPVKISAFIVRWYKHRWLQVRAASLPPAVLASHGTWQWGPFRMVAGTRSASDLQPPPPQGEVWLAADDPAPFIVRSWRPGDVIQPLGMKGRRKVADVLNDLGVPGWRKRHHLVITQNDQVVYVAGYRIAESHRVTPQTQQVCVLRVPTVPSPRA